MPENASDETGKRPVTNDMELIQQVLSLAHSTGYVLIGRGEQVYRKCSGSELEPAPLYEGDVVHQLLDAAWLKRGGSNKYSCGAYEGFAVSVLVPKGSREKAQRWQYLHPLRGCRKEMRRAGTSGEQSREETLF